MPPVSAWSGWKPPICTASPAPRSSRCRCCRRSSGTAPPSTAVCSTPTPAATTCRPTIFPAGARSCPTTCCDRTYRRWPCSTPPKPPPPRAWSAICIFPTAPRFRPRRGRWSSVSWPSSRHSGRRRSWDSSTSSSSPAIPPTGRRSSPTASSPPPCATCSTRRSPKGCSRRWPRSASPPLASSPRTRRASSKPRSMPPSGWRRPTRRSRSRARSRRSPPASATTPAL